MMTLSYLPLFGNIYSCFDQVHNLLRHIPVHPPPGGDLHHLPQYLHLPEEQKNAKPQPTSETEKDKHYPDVHFPHILHQVVKLIEINFHILTFSFDVQLAALQCVLHSYRVVRCV